MMTCKDCLHFDACESMLRALGYQCDGDGADADKRCDTFADRSRYVVREKGEWLMNRDGSCTCKKCRRTTNDAWDFDSWLNFCPNCGADMRQRENDGV